MHPYNQSLHLTHSCLLAYENNSVFVNEIFHKAAGLSKTWKHIKVAKITAVDVIFTVSNIRKFYDYIFHN